MTHESVRIHTRTEGLDRRATARPASQRVRVATRSVSWSIELIGEIGGHPGRETQSVTLSRRLANYVLICNIWDEEEQEAHYQEGMRTTFNVS